MMGETIMATTTFFEETISDFEEDVKIDLEFGRSSFYGKNLIYFKIDGKTVIVDEEVGKRICEQMSSLGFYLGYNK